MIGFTCGEHIATEIERTRSGRRLVFCRRWIPSFARCCSDCGAPRDRSWIGLEIIGRLRSGSRGGDVAKTVRRMSEASEGFRAHKRRERTGA